MIAPSAEFAGEVPDPVDEAGQKVVRLADGADARTVIKAVNPKVSPSRSGWLFWTINQNDQPLQTIR
jgi:hypothetical protein